MVGWCGDTSIHRVLQIPPSLRYADIDKPFVESIRGRLEPKENPAHSRLQMRLGMWLVKWAKGCGEVGTEWRCYLVAGESRPSSLVPDVAYLSYRRWPRDLPMDARERPRVAPDIAVEIVSSHENKQLSEEKARLYLAHGTNVVIQVCPEERTITFRREEKTECVPARGLVSVPGYGDLTLDADALFGEA